MEVYSDYDFRTALSKQASNLEASTKELYTVNVWTPCRCPKDCRNRNSLPTGLSSSLANANILTQLETHFRHSGYCMTLTYALFGFCS